MYRFLSRRTDSKFNKVVLKRLVSSRANRPPVSIAKIDSKLEGVIFVVVGTVTNDTRLQVVGKMRVCALKFTETARARIVAAGGECLTFDQLALIAPKGARTFLIKGKVTARKCYKHFGKPGSKNSKALPYRRGKGRKFEHATGKRRLRK